MEIRILFFLVFVSVTVVFNTALIFVVYKLFAGMTAGITQSMSSFRNSSETRELIQSMQFAAERAASISETAKVKLAQFDPVLHRAHASFIETLKTVDSKLDEFGERANMAAETVRDTVAKPAFTVVSFAAGVSQALQEFRDDE
jgi:hypothetical protein